MESQTFSHLTFSQPDNCCLLCFLCFYISSSSVLYILHTVNEQQNSFVKCFGNRSVRRPTFHSKVQRFFFTTANSHFSMLSSLFRTLHTVSRVTWNHISPLSPFQLFSQTSPTIKTIFTHFAHAYIRVKAVKFTVYVSLVSLFILGTKCTKYNSLKDDLHQTYNINTH